MKRESGYGVYGLGRSKSTCVRKWHVQRLVSDLWIGTGFVNHSLAEANERLQWLRVMYAQSSFRIKEVTTETVIYS